MFIAALGCVYLHVQSKSENIIINKSKRLQYHVLKIVQLLLKFDAYIWITIDNYYWHMLLTYGSRVVKPSFGLLETPRACDGPSGNRYGSGACFRSHVCCTLNLVSIQLLICQLWSPQYAWRRRESVCIYIYYIGRSRSLHLIFKFHISLINF